MCCTINTSKGQRLWFFCGLRAKSAVSLAGACNNDNGCDTGQVCENGSCSRTIGTCTKSADCGSTEVCQDGSCVPNVTPKACKQDADCTNGQTCQSGTCEDKSAAILWIQTAVVESSACWADACREPWRDAPKTMAARVTSSASQALASQALLQVAAQEY